LLAGLALAALLAWFVLTAVATLMLRVGLILAALLAGLNLFSLRVLFPLKQRLDGRKQQGDRD